MNTPYEYMLDLFQPHTIIETIKYQARAESSDCWEQHHIDAMCSACEYMSYTYPTLYKQIKNIHEQFLIKEANI